MNRLLLLLLVMFLAIDAPAADDAQTNIDRCKSIVDNNARLKCFDKIAGTPRFAINPKMAPICYVAITRDGTQACGPTNPCDPKATGIDGLEGKDFACYIIGDTPNCCSYCPPQWTGSC